MHKLLAAIVNRLPLQFRVLYRQFLIRVVDLEALSMQADIVGFLGQFAGVLLMLSFVHSLVIYAGLSSCRTITEGMAFLWHMEQHMVALTMLVVGLIAVVSWDSTFPDRRDVLVLSPLPVVPRTILLAKLAASGAVLSIAILTLNFVPSLVGSLFMGIGNRFGFFQTLAAYWCAVTGASLFLYCSVLSIQGLSALLLPRRLFLRLSAILQLVAFGLFLGVFFLQPVFTTPAEIAAPANQWVLAFSPSYWFFGIFNQLSGARPHAPTWLAQRGWSSLAIVAAGAAVSLILCYLRTMKKTVEEPDLVPGPGGLHWSPRFGSALQTAILLFSIRSLTRSRQHRVAFSFYLALVFAIALSWLRSDLADPRPTSLPTSFLVGTFMMMSFAVFGLRSVFALPISLTANWMLRTTQLRPSNQYISATRRSLLLFAALPAWLLSAALSLTFRPWNEVAEHLTVVALVGGILTEFSLVGFYKVPFTCSYLPGKSNIQLVFWAFFIGFIPLAILAAVFELRVLHIPLQFAFLVAALAALEIALLALNRHRAQSAQLYFEELPEELLTTLKLSA